MCFASFFFSSRRRHTRYIGDWSSDVCSSDLPPASISLAYRAIEAGGTAPAVLNAADEIAVEAFLNRKIPFSDIPKLIAATLEAHKPNKADRLETIIEADTWARKYARQWLS